MITELERSFCWSYNIFNVEKFKRIVSGENVDFTIQTSDGRLSPDLERIVNSRTESLKNGTFKMEFNDDILSYNLSILIASISTRGKKWFVEREVNLFKTRIEKTSVELINELFQEKDRVIKRLETSELREVSSKALHDPVKAKWTLFSSLLKERKFTVRSGWIYTTLYNIIPIIVDRYKKGLSKKLKQDWKLINEDKYLKPIFEKYAKEMDGMIEEKNDLIVAPKEIESIISMSPMCIKVIDDDVKHGVDIGYEAYIIMAFYMKTFLKIEDLKRYFYERNSVNLKSFSSVDQYISSIKNLGYVFDYMYGSSGSGTSYESYACKKIVDADFCPFSSPADVEKVVEKHDSEILALMEDDKRRGAVNLIKNVSSKRKMSRACGIELSLKLMINLDEKMYVNHPVKAYFQKIIEVMEKRKQEQEKKTEEK